MIPSNAAPATPIIDHVEGSGTDATASPAGWRSPGDKVGVDRCSRGGVVFANRVIAEPGLADIELCTGASGHGQKRDDAEKERAEGATQRPPI